MSYNVLDYAVRKDGKYQVDPGKIVPATIAHIRACVKGTEEVTDIVTPGWVGRPYREPVADRFLRRAEVVTDEGWKLALTPYVKPDPKDEEAMRKYTLRGNVLDLVENWWQRALTIAGQKPISVYISRNPDYKRW